MRPGLQKKLVVWAVGILIALGIWIPHFTLPDLYDRGNDLIFDAYQRVKPRQWANSSVVVVEIDQESIDTLGQWPWPRNLMADMTDRLGQLGAAAIVFDVVFSEPDRTSPYRAINRLQTLGVNIELPDDQSDLDNDKLFANAIGRNNVVTGMALSYSDGKELPQPKAGYAISGTLPDDVMSYGVKSIRNLEIFDQQAAGTGLFSLEKNRIGDGVIREVVLLTGINSAFYPTLAVEALRVAQGASGYKLKSSDGSGEANLGELRLTSVQVGALTVPTDELGSMRIYHSYSQTKPTIPAYALLNSDSSTISLQDLANMIAGRIVLVGASATGLLDLRTTPLQAVVPGVSIHADIIDQLIAQQHLVRPDYAKGVELTAAIGATILLLALIPFVNALLGGLLALTISLSSIWLFWLQFSDHLLLFSPLLVLISIISVFTVSSAVQFLLTQKEGAFLREAFGQYLSPTLVDQLTRSPEKLILGGETKCLTLLFCDIRGFTTLSEKLGPTELTALLNQFLTPMTGLLLKNGATIDKYMGDAIMAFWNAPIDQENHRELACKSVLEMRAALTEINNKLEMELYIGIGLNTGSSCVGNLGSEQRFSYSAIGDAVNVASRIEGLTKQYGLDNLASGETVDGADGLNCLEIDRVAVVGRKEPITVFHILDTQSEAAGSTYQYQSLHEKFMQQYKNALFSDAKKSLALLTETAPENLQKLYTVYSERVCELERTGVPIDWDGVFVADQK